MRNLFSLILLGSIFFASSVAANAEINQTTDRFKRTEYMCRVTEEDFSKPLPAGLDFFRMSHGHYGVADLYGDGKLDFFFGFSDDTFDLDRIEKSTNQPLDPLFGNEERSNKNHQYSFYSQDPHFIVPNNTKYLIARTFSVQDYNNDGIDDYAVAHWGRDYPPFDGRKNELMLSSPEGYKFSILPGGSGLNHSSAAGDVDGDGDIDLIFARLAPDELIFLENLGKGNFKVRKKVGVSNMPAGLQGETIRLWDVNHDGNLDLITGYYSKAIPGSFAQIFWGLPGFRFENNPTILQSKEPKDEGPVIMRNGYKMETEPTALDFEFGDFDQDGKVEIVASLQMNFYRDWALVIVDLDGRDADTTIIDKSDPENFFSLFWIHACDLKEDGKLDLVYEHFGQNYIVARMRMNGKQDSVSAIEKIVWQNNGNRNFRRYLLENSIYFDQKYKEYFLAAAEWLGVSGRFFQPKQKYFDNVLTSDETYIHPFFKEGSEIYRRPYLFEESFVRRFVDLEFFGVYRSAPSVVKTSTTVSKRVKEIIERRKKGNFDSGKVMPLENAVPPSVESVRKTNDPDAVSGRVKSILEQRRSQNGG